MNNMDKSDIPDVPLTSTPEKSTEHNLTNISAATSLHFSENIKELTPIDDLKSLTYHDKEYLSSVIKKANEGSTFFPQTAQKYSQLSIPGTQGSLNSTTHDDDLTPLFKKLPKKAVGLNIKMGESTPLNEKIKMNNIEQSEKQQFTFTNSSRNIFNLAPEFQSKPDLDLPMNEESNIVKNAFNVFDKSNNSFISGSSSINSRTFKKAKKRFRVSNDDISDYQNLSNKSILTKLDNNKSLDNDPLFNTRPRTNSKRDWFHSVLSDPQCMTNMTLLIQILLNTLMILIFLGFGAVAFLAIKRDVDRKITSYISEAIHKINTCKREYLRNNCAPEMRVPALEYKCNEWDTCMEQDPESVITSMAYFEVLADCMNAFFHNISIKSLLGIGCVLIFCIIVPNILFSRFRSTTINKNYYNNNSNNSNKNDHVIPSSPQRVIRNEQASFGSPNVSDRQHVANNSGVRFNPNVSYSFYENEVNAIENSEYDVNFEGNKRILLE